MAVIRDTVIPLDDYPTGSAQLGPFNVPNSTTSLYIEIQRCTSADLTIWPNATTTLQVEFELSIDSAVWTKAGGMGAVGGIFTTRGGIEAPISTLTVPLPTVNGRKIRVNIDITNGPLRTSGTMELRD